MADETQKPHKTRLDIEARPKLTGTAAFKGSLGDLAGEMAEPGIVLAAGGTKAQAAWAGMRGILLSKVLGPLGLITGAVVGLGAAMKIVVGQSQLLARGLKEARGLETLLTQFRPLLGSAQAAEARLAELFKFAETTPFRINGIAESSRILEIMTNGALSTSEGLRMIGDSAAIAGRPLKEVSFWVGRLYDALQSGSPTGEAMMRLQEMGVVSGSTRREIEQLTEAGANSRGIWAMVEKELKRNEGGMKLLSQTADGLNSTLSDARAAMSRGFGESFLQQEKDAIRSAITVTEAFIPVVAELGRLFAAITAPARMVGNAIKQNKALMEGLATATLGAVKAFVVFGAAAVTAQAAVTGSALGQMVKNLGGLSASLKTAIAYKLNFAKASKASAVASSLSARAIRLEAAAAAASTAANKQMLVAMAARNRAAAATVTGAKGMSAAMAGSTIRGRILSKVLKTFAGVGKLIAGVFKAAFATMFTGLGLVGTVVGGAVAATLLWVQATRRQKKHLDELRSSQREVNREARKQLGAIETMEDKLAAEAERIKELASAYKQLAEERNKGNDEGAEVALKNLQEAKQNLEDVQGTNPTKSESDISEIKRRLDLEREIENVLFRAQMERATAEEKALLLTERRKDLEERIAAAEALRARNKGKANEDADLENQKGELEADLGFPTKRLQKLKDAGENFNSIVKNEESGLFEMRNKNLEVVRNPETGRFSVKNNDPAGGRLIGGPSPRTMKLLWDQKRIKEEIAKIEAEQQARRDAAAKSARDPDQISTNRDAENMNALKAEVVEIGQQLRTATEDAERFGRVLEQQTEIGRIRNDLADAVAMGDMEGADRAGEELRAAERRLQIEQRIRQLRNEGLKRPEASRRWKGSPQMV